MFFLIFFDTFYPLTPSKEVEWFPNITSLMLQISYERLMMIPSFIDFAPSSGARKVSKVYPKKCNIYQEEFHRHFNSEGHNGMEDWNITIIDRAEMF